LFGMNYSVVSGTGAGYVEARLSMFLLKAGLLSPLAVVCNSKAGRQSVREACGGHIPTLYIPNGIDEVRTSGKPTFPLPSWVGSKRPIVGYIGKFDSKKRADRMIALAERLRDHPSRPLFAVFGSGPGFEAAAQSVRAAKLEGVVSLEGKRLDAPRLA